MTTCKRLQTISAAPIVRASSSKDSRSGCTTNLAPNVIRAVGASPTTNAAATHMPKTPSIAILRPNIASLLLANEALGLVPATARGRISAHPARCGSTTVAIARAVRANADCEPEGRWAL